MNGLKKRGLIPIFFLLLVFPSYTKVQRLISTLTEDPFPSFYPKAFEAPSQPRNSGATVSWAFLSGETKPGNGDRRLVHASRFWRRFRGFGRSLLGGPLLLNVALLSPQTLHLPSVRTFIPFFLFLHSRPTSILREGREVTEKDQGPFSRKKRLHVSHSRCHLLPCLLSMRPVYSRHLSMPVSLVIPQFPCTTN